MLFYWNIKCFSHISFSYQQLPFFLKTKFICKPKNNIYYYSTQSNEIKVPMNLIKELRKRTLAGYMDCQKALKEENLNIEKAIEWLKKKGALKAASKANRITKEGLVGLSINSNNTTGVIVEINSETDFVSRGELFKNLTKEITDYISNFIKPNIENNKYIYSLNIEEIKKSVIPFKNQTIENIIADIVGKLGENIKLRRAVQVHIPSGKGYVCGYVHRIQEKHENGVTLGGIASLVVLETTSNNTSILIPFGNHLAQHIVGFSPDYLYKEDIPESVLETYKNQYKEEMKHLEESKPFKPEKLFEDIVLMEQDFFSEKKKVSEVLKELSLKINSEIKIGTFIKYICGEGITKLDENFGNEIKNILDQTSK